MNSLANHEEICELQRSINLLKNISVFSGLTPDFCRVLAYLCERQIFAPHQMILNQGESADGAVIVVKGTAHMELLERGNVAVVEKGACVGALALLGKFRWLYSLRAETELECLLLPRHKFLPQFMAQPDALLSVTQGLIGEVVFWEKGQLELAGGSRSYGLAML